MCRVKIDRCTTIYEDWSFLLTDEHILKSKDEPCTQNAIKLLYLLSGSKDYFSREVTDLPINNATFELLLQTARESKSIDSYTHVGVILQVLRGLDVSLEDFFKLEIPVEFMESLVTPRILLRNTYACIAPWCVSYHKPGSLVRTATSKKEINSKVYNYYMYCNECGIEYAIDSTDRQLAERGYFINLGWDIIRPLLLKGTMRKKISIKLGIHQDTVRRCSIFLYANGLIKKEYINIDIPDQINPDKVVKLIKYVESGGKAKQGPKEFGWSYPEFLFYWFQPEVRKALLKRIIPKPGRESNHEKRHLSVLDALDHFLKTGRAITITEIGKYMGLCSETLRLWGALPFIKEAKQQQRKQFLKERNLKIIKEARAIIEKFKNNEEKILSDSLYQMLGVNRRILVRDSPEVNAAISKLLREN